MLGQNLQHCRIFHSSMGHPLGQRTESRIWFDHTCTWGCKLLFDMSDFLYHTELALEIFDGDFTKINQAEWEITHGVAALPTVPWIVL
jgi:hypothetical protein